MTDRPFANLRNLISGEEAKQPRHGTPKPASLENRDDARQAINVIHTSKGDFRFCNHADMCCPDGTCDWSGRDGPDG